MAVADEADVLDEPVCPCFYEYHNSEEYKNETTYPSYEVNHSFGLVNVSLHEDEQVLKAWTDNATLTCDTESLYKNEPAEYFSLALKEKPPVLSDPVFSFNLTDSLSFPRESKKNKSSMSSGDDFFPFDQMDSGVTTIVVPVSALFGTRLKFVPPSKKILLDDGEKIITVPMNGQLYRVVPASGPGVFHVHLRNSEHHWSSPLELSLSTLTDNAFYNAVIVLAALLDTVQSEFAAEFVYQYSPPGITELMYSSKKGRVYVYTKPSNGQSGQRQPTRRENKERRREDDRSSEGAGPPRQPHDKSDLEQIISEPALLAIGLGLNPFAPELQPLTTRNVYLVARQRGLMGVLDDAVQYHNRVLRGETGYNRFLHPPEVGSFPGHPTLYYLAQIQPFQNPELLAERLNTPGDVLSYARRAYRDNLRLYQIFLFRNAYERRITWAELNDIYVTTLFDSNMRLEPQTDQRQHRRREPERRPRQSGENRHQRPPLPRTPEEFRGSYYESAITNPALLALGLGLQPFSPEFQPLTVHNIIAYAHQGGLLNNLGFALEFHNRVLGGQTDFENYVLRYDARVLPPSPDLFYLAQIQPARNIERLITMIDPPIAIRERAQRAYGHDPRLHQMYLFQVAYETGISWEELSRVYRGLMSEAAITPGAEAAGGDTEETVRHQQQSVNHPDSPPLPRTPQEFIGSYYEQVLRNPALLALGLGMEPFVPKLEPLTILNVITYAHQRGLLQNLGYAVKFHNQVITGRTGFDNYLSDPGVHSLPQKPELFHLSQIQPISNLQRLAMLLQVPEAVRETGQRIYGHDPRLHQMYLFQRARERGISWETLDQVYHRATAEPDVGSSTPPVNTASAPDPVIEVEYDYTPETHNLDQAISQQIQLLPRTGGSLRHQDERSQISNLNIPREYRRLFAAALRLNPGRIQKGNNLPSIIDIATEAERRTAGFGWNHIGLALQLTGLLHNHLHLPSVQAYAQNFGNIVVEPITGNTGYHEVGQQLSALLANIELNFGGARRPPASAHSLPQPEQPTRQSCDEQNECAVCKESDKLLNTLLIPCGHYGVCEDCSKRLSTCPVCRKPVRETKKIYKM